MRKQTSLLAPACLALALTLGACIVQPAASSPGKSAQAVPKASPGVAPASLNTLEADAEDIMDFAAQDSWERIQKDTTHMRAAWQMYLPQAEQAGVSKQNQTAMTEALERLAAAVKAKEARATLQAANDVSAVVVELFALYNPQIPADIGRLDVLERQVILDVAAGDWAKAEQTLTETIKIWLRVKPSALEQKGDEAVADYDASLSAQTDGLKAKNVKKLTTEATNGLEIVDALEQVYIR